MRFLWNIPPIITAVILILSLIIQGYVSAQAGSIILVAIIFLIVAGRAIGGSIGRIVRLLLRFGFPIASMLVLIIIWGYGNPSFLIHLAVILTMLIGIYIMFSGLFPSGHS